MSEEKTITVEGWFGKDVEKTKDEFVGLWVRNADLFKLVVCDGTENYKKTNEKVSYLREEIKKLAAFNWECSYKEQEAKKLKENV